MQSYIKKLVGKKIVNNSKGRFKVIKLLQLVAKSILYIFINE